jgi:aspartate aminotransferase-like enzyme
VIIPGILVFAADNGLQVIVDGVCSVASEEIKFDDWGIDVVLTASQKGLGVPPGLSLLCASERAIKVTSSMCRFGQLISDTEGLTRCSKNERLP